MFDKKPNCELTVHMKFKAELFAPLGLQKKLGYEEGERFITKWQIGFTLAKIYSRSDGRKWERKCPVAFDKSRPRHEQLVGQSRLRLMDPAVSPPPRFQPIKKLQCWLGTVGGVLTLELSQPLQIAPKRSVDAYKRHTSKRASV